MQEGYLNKHTVLIEYLLSVTPGHTDDPPGTSREHLGPELEQGPRARAILRDLKTEVSNQLYVKHLQVGIYVSVYWLMAH